MFWMLIGIAVVAFVVMKMSENAANKSVLPEMLRRVGLSPRVYAMMEHEVGSKAAMNLFAALDMLKQRLAGSGVPWDPELALDAALLGMQLYQSTHAQVPVGEKLVATLQRATAGGQSARVHGLLNSIEYAYRELIRRNQQEVMSEPKSEAPSASAEDAARSFVETESVIKSICSRFRFGWDDELARRATTEAFGAGNGLLLVEIMWAATAQYFKTMGASALATNPADGQAVLEFISSGALKSAFKDAVKMLAEHP